MRFSLAIFLLLSLAFSANCLRRSYDIKITLVGPNKNEPVQRSSQSSLVIDQSGPSLRSSNVRLIEHNAGDCENCIYSIEFVPNDQSKTLYTSIKANLVSGKSFEDFVEVAFGEHDDIIGIKYGISKYLQEGQQGQQTLIAESKVASQFESPDVTTSFGVGKAPGPGAPSGNVGGGEPGEPRPEEKTFFQKYMWWIIIGGFIAYQFMTFDKTALMDAANQAQNQQQRRQQ